MRKSYSVKYIDGSVEAITRERLLGLYLVPAIYQTAHANTCFSTADVYQKLADLAPSICVETLRKAIGQTKLIAVALRKAQAQRYCSPNAGEAAPVDELSHRRRRALWRSHIVA